MKDFEHVLINDLACLDQSQHEGLVSYDGIIKAEFND